MARVLGALADSGLNLAVLWEKVFVFRVVLTTSILIWKGSRGAKCYAKLQLGSLVRCRPTQCSGLPGRFRMAEVATS